MKPYRFAKTEILRLLAEWEFRYHGNNTNVFFRERYLRAQGVDFRGPISLGLDFYLREPGRLKIGSHCSFGSYTRIWNYAAIEIGDHFLSAGGLTMNCGSHDLQTLSPSAGEIRIGHRVWVGLNVTILGGVEIGDDVVIGAGSLVTKNIPSGTVWAGVPARQIKEIDRGGLKALWGAWGPVKMPPATAEIQLAVANRHLTAGDQASARKALAEALSSHPAEATQLVQIAELALRLEAVELFETALAEALSVEPESPAAHRLLGGLLLAGGQPEAALAHFQRVVSRSANDVTAQLGLAQCLHRCGRVPEAVIAYEAVLHLSPENRDAALNLQAVRGMCAA